MYKQNNVNLNNPQLLFLTGLVFFLSVTLNVSVNSALLC